MGTWTFLEIIGCRGLPVGWKIEYFTMTSHDRDPFLSLRADCAGVLRLPARAGAPTRFDWRTDTVAFSNDTVFAYGIDEAGHLSIHRRARPARFAHRCFVLVRAVLQFHKFARFAPDQPQAGDAEYRALILRVCRVPVWMPERRDGRNASSFPDTET